MTATWKVYSVTRLGVLFEKEARIETMESLSSGLNAWKVILTEVFETTISLDCGKEEPSSGRAEAKVQSSSVVVPLLAG